MTLVELGERYNDERLESSSSLCRFEMSKRTRILPLVDSADAENSVKVTRALVVSVVSVTELVATCREHYQETSPLVFAYEYLFLWLCL